MHLFTLPILVFLSMSSGCAQDNSSGSEKKSDSGKPSDSVDPDLGGPGNSETDQADTPIEVTGAFLTAFGTPKAGAAAVQAGFRPVGVNLFESVGGKKTGSKVQVQNISYLIGDVVQNTVPLLKNNGTWHAIFEVPADTPDPIVGIIVTLTVDESLPLDLDSLTFPTYDAETEASALPDFTAEISAKNLTPVPVLQNVSTHLLFVSNGRYLPQVHFTGVTGANVLCNREAQNESNLAPYWWKAVLADETQTLEERIPLFGQVTNLDLETLVAQQSKLGTSKIPAGLLQFANYGAVGTRPDDLAFTGINEDGTTGNTCQSWSAASSSAAGGDPSTGNDWLTGSDVSCGKASRLYCISTKVKRAVGVAAINGQ